MLLEERVALGEVERPGLELREIVERRCLEELLHGERHEVGWLDEDVAPDLVGVAAELPEGRRRDGRELAVSLGVDVNDEGAVHVGDARLDDARGEELLPEELVERLVEVGLDLRGDGEVDRRVARVVEVPVAGDAVAAVDCGSACS